jgi:hypothetical protein
MAQLYHPSLLKSFSKSYRQSRITTVMAVVSADELLQGDIAFECGGGQGSLVCHDIISREYPLYAF